MNQDELALDLAEKRSTVADWETGEKTPELRSLINAAKYFGVTLDELVLKKLKPPLPLYVLNIKYLRERYSMTQENMANYLGYRDSQEYGMVETGECGISVEILEKIADFFVVTLDQMVKHDLSKEGV